jgi:hypothetical protein
VRLRGRIKCLEGRGASRDGGNASEVEGRRGRTEELRGEILTRVERVLDEERRKGTPEPSPEERTANHQAFLQALRRRAGLG